MIKRTYPNSRLRRTRAKGFLRDLVAENNLTTDDLIQPIFIADQSENRIEIPSMPGIYRHNLDSLYSEIDVISRQEIKSVAIFPAINPSKKDQEGSHALDEKNIELKKSADNEISFDQKKNTNEDLNINIKQGNYEDDLLQIPAFLRRQAN